jgi:hypothetical protein
VLALPLGGETLRLVLLRNPHGKGEWSGAFCDRDLKARWPDVKLMLEHWNGCSHSNKDDGAFYMSYDDFVE